MELPLDMGFWLNALVAILLAVTVGYCLILNRRLTALRGNQAEMRKLLSEFTDAARQAETSASHLKTVSDQIAGTLDQRMTEGRALADELNSITKSGERLAERIENGLVGRSGPDRQGVVPGDNEGASATLSESERELAEILRQAR